MEAEDISEYLSKLFIEVELLTFDIKAFYTAKKNQALIVNNFVYHLKTVGKSSHRWVCKSCLASITTGSGPTEEDIHQSWIELAKTGKLKESEDLYNKRIIKMINNGIQWSRLNAQITIDNCQF